MQKVLVFGSFDPLHKGHGWFFSQAKAAGDYLVVIVARDSAIRGDKGREPRRGELERLEEVQKSSFVDEARLGNERPSSDPYKLLGVVDFDVLALGYDQQPDDEEVLNQLTRHGRGRVRIFRVAALKPEKYKSSLMRGDEDSF